MAGVAVAPNRVVSIRTPSQTTVGAGMALARGRSGRAVAGEGAIGCWISCSYKEIKGIKKMGRG
jgi:hypothetical protein